LDAWSAWRSAAVAELFEARNPNLSCLPLYIVFGEARRVFDEFDRRERRLWRDRRPKETDE
jgi:hypothetical protein